jgi:hypothetical protein
MSLQEKMHNEKMRYLEKKLALKQEKVALMERAVLAIEKLCNKP